MTAAQEFSPTRIRRTGRLVEAALQPDGETIESSATMYFAHRFFESATAKAKISGRLSSQRIEEVAALYDEFVPMVTEARRLLDSEHSALLASWQVAEGDTREAYKEVVTDVLMNDVVFFGHHNTANIQSFGAKCFNVVQWMEGWLRWEYGRTIS